MTKATAQPTTGEERDSRPLGVKAIRACACRLLAPDAEPPTLDELETLTLQLRGHLMVTIPEVEGAAQGLPEDDVPRACALACVGDARMRLGLEPSQTLPAGIAYAQRLARSVNALCDHYENLGGERS